MKNNVKLLPHKWQKVGFWAFAASIIATAAIGLTMIYDIWHPGKAVITLVVAIAYLSVICMVFSEEKKEDDNVQNIRLRTIGLCVLLTLGAVLLLNIVHALLPPDSFQALKTWRQDYFWNGRQLILLLLLYLAILKIRISANKF